MSVVDVLSFVTNTHAVFSYKRQIYFLLRKLHGTQKRGNKLRNALGDLSAQSSGYDSELHDRVQALQQKIGSDDISRQRYRIQQIKQKRCSIDDVLQGGNVANIPYHPVIDVVV